MGETCFRISSWLFRHGNGRLNTIDIVLTYLLGSMWHYIIIQGNPYILENVGIPRTIRQYTHLEVDPFKAHIQMPWMPICDSLHMPLRSILDLTG